MPDYSKATTLATEVAEKATAKNNRAWIRENLEVVENGLADKTYEAYVQMLNDECGFNISVSVFANYVSDARKARSSSRLTTSSKPEPRSNNSSQTPLKKTSRILNLGKVEPEDDWNETEHLIGYRLEDCIRPFVTVVDDKIVQNFRKGTIFTLEIRNALSKLRNKVEPF